MKLQDIRVLYRLPLKQGLKPKRIAQIPCNSISSL